MQVFFILDTCYCQTEYDDLKDAILYFYPPDISENQACNLCGQLFGTAEFFRATFCWPKLMRLSRGKFTLKKWGDYLLGLGGSSDSSDMKLIEGLDYLCKIFSFYYKSIENFKEECLRSGAVFKKSVSTTWAFILKSVKENARGTGRTFVLCRHKAMPRDIYLLANHILLSCQRAGSFIGGCIFYQHKVVATQLPPELTFILSHCFKEWNFSHAPMLPEGINISTVHVKKSLLQDVLQMNCIPGNLYKNKEQVFEENSSSDLEKTTAGIYDADVDSSFEDDRSSRLQCTEETQGVNSETGSDKWSSLSLEGDGKSRSSLMSSDKSEKQHCLNVNINSLHSVFNAAKDSLRRLNINKEKPQQILKKKSVNEKSQNILVAFNSAIETSLNRNCIYQNELIKPKVTNDIDENSADSSFYEPREWTPETRKRSVHSASKNSTYDNEFISSWEASSVNFLGNHCPIVIWNDGLGDDVKACHSIKAKNYKTKPNSASKPFDSRNVKPIGLKPSAGSTTNNSVSNNDYARDTTSLTLCVYSVLDTTCYLLSDETDIEALKTMLSSFFVPLNCLNKDLLEAKIQLSPDLKDYSSEKSISCDNVWNVVEGDKMTKSFSVVENSIGHSNIKSLSMQTSSGIKYAHSSITHSVYMESETLHGIFGIPGSKDALSKVSQLNKNKYEKMGFYLLK